MNSLNEQEQDLKVLHYISDFSLPSETFIYDLINIMEKSHQVNNWILTHRRHLESERPFKKTIVIKPDIITRIVHKIEDYEGYSISNHKATYREIKIIQPSIIHSHFGPNGIRMNKLLQKYKLVTPQVVSFHGMDVNTLPYFKKGYLENIHHLGKQENVYFTAPSEFLMNRMIKLGIHPEKIKIIRNSFNSSFLEIKCKKNFNYGDKLKILNVGRLESVKGQQYLIEAFSIFSSTYTNAHLTIIGEGSLEKQLKNVAKRLGVSEKVDFLGKMPHQKIPEIMADHDIYVQPSIVNERNEEENSPISVLEALSIGLPVIASNIGGLKEIIKNGENGFLVPQKSVNDIVLSLTQLLEQPETLARIKQYARFYVQRNYSSEFQCKSMIGLYEEVAHV